MCQSHGPCVCCVSLCVCKCLWFQIRVLVKNYICQTSVNLTPVKVTVMLVLIYIAGGVNVYFKGCVSLSAPVCAVCLCVCVCVFVWYQIRVLVKNHMFQTSVNLMPVKRAVGVGVWWRQGWTKFEKVGRKYRAGLHKIGC